MLVWTDKGTERATAQPATSKRPGRQAGSQADNSKPAKHKEPGRQAGSQADNHKPAAHKRPGRQAGSQADNHEPAKQESITTQSHAQEQATPCPNSFKVIACKHDQLRMVQPKLIGREMQKQKCDRLISKCPRK